MPTEDKNEDENELKDLEPETDARGGSRSTTDPVKPEPGGGKIDPIFPSLD